MVCQGGTGVARHGDQGHPQALEHRQQRRKLTTFATVGDGQHQVVGSHHAQIAVAGLGGVNKKSRGTGGCQGGRNLAPDMAAFAHAHDHHTPGGLQNALHGLHKAGVHTCGQPRQGGGLDVKRFPRQAQNLVRIKREMGGGSHVRILSTGVHGLG